jgi:hypothetical protein
MKARRFIPRLLDVVGRGLPEGAQHPRREEAGDVGAHDLADLPEQADLGGRGRVIGREAVGLEGVAREPAALAGVDGSAVDDVDPEAAVPVAPGGVARIGDVEGEGGTGCASGGVWTGGAGA